ncbi:cytochrome P450 [Actinomadura barringtoniae]|uniref:Cytochrome P450 n=1 Tax=Actinomadura barringtoniae TaxID=1427535 RepID=A0A939PDS9_9ACTN|nr:cytochrome P450 [Actinomadura barringtoniae]MBO2448233.1 cytochrome P450 [Actinomadura barringtoniae]
MTELHTDLKIDLLDGEMYATDPWSVYARLRAEAPVYHDAENGLWGIARHADIFAIERNAKLWSNAGGYRPQLPSDPSMIGHDDPEHMHRRRMVYQRFTPRGVSRYAEKIRSTAVDCIETALEAGTVDAIPALAAPLPARVIGWLLGFPEEAWPQLVHWSETAVFAGGGQRYVTEKATVAAGEFALAVLEMAKDRRACPSQDLLSIWSNAGPDDPSYGDQHLAHEALLLLVGGAETTRTVIATAIDALISHPDQWRLLRSDPSLIGGAVEEFVRWTTPILNMCRTPNVDAEVSGVTIPAGEQVLLMYGSANRDEEVFERPDVLDVTRTPGDHIAFGLGPHFCLGASLARLELQIFFEEFVARVEAAEWADDEGPRILRNAFVRGVTEFPITLTRRATA